jgi:hypothetical protein
VSILSKSIGSTVIDFEKGEADDSAYFEAHDSNLNGADYTVRLYPASIYGKCEFAVTTGRIESPGGGGAGLIRDERITLDGKATYKPSKPATDLSSQLTGLYFDESDNRISPPSISVANGEITIDPPCFGILIISYYTPYTLLNYTANLRTLGGQVMGRDYGTIIAFKGKKVLATFEVPTPGVTEGKKIIVATIYRDVLVAGIRGNTNSGRYELPDVFGETISYTHYPAADTSDLESDTPRVREIQAEVYFSSVGESGDGQLVGTIGSDDKDKLIFWNYPTSQGLIGLFSYRGVAWKVETQLPGGLAPSAIEKINEEIDRLKLKYHIT